MHPLTLLLPLLATPIAARPLPAQDTGAASRSLAKSLVVVDLVGRAPELARLLASEFDVVTHDIAHGGTPEGLAQAELLVSLEEQAELARIGLDFEVVHEDLAAFYAARAAQAQGQKQSPPSLGAWLNPPFGQGSLAGFYTFSEVVSVLDQITAAYPNITTDRFSIGATLEGRQIYAVKVSDNPDTDEAEPEVRFDAMHHAREPQSMQTTIWALLCLLENYGTDPLATYLVDEREMWFLPVVNPDGYAYNEQTNPGGGGLWRKNRRNNGGGSFGVDLNRNYDYQWGFDNNGSSNSTSSETYRGTGPASEPETVAMQAFIDGRDFKTALSTHSFSNLWLHAWGYDIVPTPNDAEYSEISSLATEINGYPAGPANTVLYPANGVTIDYDQGAHGTLSWTPEIGSSNDGFWPLPSRIVPLAQENEEAFLRTAWAAGAYVREISTTIVDVGDGDGFFEPGENVEVTIEVRNSGLAAASADLELASSDANVTIATAQVSLGNVSSFANASNAGQPLSLTIQAGAASGSAVSFETSIVYEGFAQTTTHTIFVGQPKVFVADDAEVDLGWIAGLPGDTATTGQWESGDPVGTTSNGAPANPEDDATAGGGRNCFTTGNGSTSAGGDDVDNGLTTLISPAIDLSGVAGAIVKYQRWYADLSVQDDAFQVSISDDDGATWVALETLTQTANAWTEASFVVGDFVDLTNEVRLRFIAEDDPNNSIVEAAVDELEVQIFDAEPRLNLFGSAQLGTPIATHVTGAAGESYTVFVSPNTGNLVLPNVQGTILIDASMSFRLLSGTLPASGSARNVSTIPNDTNLIGAPFYLQSLHAGVSGLRVSNRDEILFLP